MRNLVAGLALAATLSVPDAARADEKDLWIHLEVREAGKEGAKIDVNLPLSLVEVALDMAPDDVIADGRLNIRHSDLSVADLRRIWNEVRAAGEADFVTVQDKGETVRIMRRGDRLSVHVSDRAKGDQKVRIEVPVALVDALFAGEGDALDVRGALTKLETVRGQVLEVQDGGSHIRVWIDERSAPAP